ncbi:MAG TPA: hypothetical protein PLR88_12180 [Bacteroidales bacterium]|nr:hypothetical protein [Bacteroidales bacterium]HPT22694.1 hypothetical protein [Bacteroidales bacterium]
MKKIIYGIILICLALPAGAQNTFNKGDKVLNLGLGLGSTFYTGGGYTSKIPPISASFEMGIKDHLFDEKSSIGVGGYVGYTSAKYEYGTDYGWKYSDFIIGARGTFHYQLIDKFDTYTGLMVGYDIATSKEYGTWAGSNNYSSASSGAEWSWFVGGRYYFSDNIAGMVELGYGIAYLNLGIGIKF